MVNQDCLLIEGLGGRRALSGVIKVRGSKNAALPAMAAALLFEDSLILNNLPKIDDVKKMAELITELGPAVKIKNREISVNPAGLKRTDLETERAKKMRASIFLAGPTLARLGEVSFPHPGGCVIGERPIDFFLDGFRKMGATAEFRNGRYRLKSRRPKLRGAQLFFPLTTVGGTETFMMAAVLAEGRTVLKNAALEPEVTALGELMVAGGAKIKGLGTTTLEIQGGRPLKNFGRKNRIIADRLETGCFLILGALAARSLTIADCQPAHLEIVVELLKKAGAPISVGRDFIKISSPKTAKPFKSFNLKTREYPGFPTDLQAPAAVFLTQAQGQGLLFETIFDGRLNYLQDLSKMGAEIALWDAHRALIKGPTALRGRELDGPDIRAGLAFIIAAVVAKGRSVINNVHYIDRGYEKIEERLRKIGVDIKRMG